MSTAGTLADALRTFAGFIQMNPDLPVFHLTVWTHYDTPTIDVAAVAASSDDDAKGAALESWAQRLGAEVVPCEEFHDTSRRDADYFITISRVEGQIGSNGPEDRAVDVRLSCSTNVRREPVSA